MAIFGYQFKSFLAFFCCWLVAASLLGYQQKLIAKRQPAQCLQAFTSNNWYGVLMWLAIILNYLL